MIPNGIPTLWQNVIYRNWGTIPVETLAEVLETDGQTVTLHAQKMGLGNVKPCALWQEKGFVTVIRNNWDLLPNDKIARLLGISEKELDRLLCDFDFLDEKLGKKLGLPFTPYSPLTEEQEKQTQTVKTLTERNFLAPAVAPFDFYRDTPYPRVEIAENAQITDRFTAIYGGNYGDTLLDDELSDYSDEYLERIKASGVNGLWLHETLRNLAPFPFDEAQCGDYERRTANLRKLTERCAKKGVHIYLYLNEPRSLPAEFFEKYPHLRGQKISDNEYCLCTSTPEVQEYLYNAVKYVAERAPLLRGVMTITMSENPTHCYARQSNAITDCPRCSLRSAEEVAAEVNNICYRALQDGNGYTKLIANLWAWSHFYAWTDEMVLRGVELLDKGIEVLCVSEYSMDYERGGVRDKVVDYSISLVGPGEIAVKMLQKAKELGHKTWVKVQINNSWECSGVPYLPVFDLMVKHIKNVKALGVTGIMLGWSLGGYPGGALPLCALHCTQEDFDEEGWYRETYGMQAPLTQKAVKIFSKAFEEYPFHVCTIYGGGHTLACGHIWELERTLRPSTMVCFTYDDYESWTHPYGLDGYIRQFSQLCEGWQEGLLLLENEDGNVSFREFKRYAEGAYVQMHSALNWAIFVKYKNDLLANKEKLLAVLQSEREMTERLYRLISTDAKIGYEVSNHYFYNANLLLEKLLNLSYLESKILQN